jgi:hypothetical protein
VAVPDDLLPERVSVCLVDVDLEIPVYESLRRTFGRLAPGGSFSWMTARRPLHGLEPVGATSGSFTEAGLPERYEFGLGIVTV